jgi:hypothetical protein
MVAPVRLIFLSPKGRFCARQRKNENGKKYHSTEDSDGIHL